MPSERLAGAELNPLLASPFVGGGGPGTPTKLRHTAERLRAGDRQTRIDYRLEHAAILSRPDYYD